MGCCHSCRRRSRSKVPKPKAAMPGTLVKDWPKLHSRPIIGVMSVMADRSPLGRLVLPAAYVKSVEASGARVVPVFPDQPETYYRKLFERLNGLFIPGGSGAPCGLQRPTTDAVALFYRWSIEAYEQQQLYWPIWGTCLGLEMLLDITEGLSGKLLSQCDMPARSFPLKLTSEAKDTRLIASMPEDVLKVSHRGTVLTVRSSMSFLFGLLPKVRCSLTYTPIV